MSTVARPVDASDARFGGCPRVRRVNFRGWASTVVGRAAAVGSQPSDTPDERLRKSALVLSSLLITILSFVWVGTYAALGLWRSAFIPFAYQVASLVGPLKDRALPVPSNPGEIHIGVVVPLKLPLLVE